MYRIKHILDLQIVDMYEDDFQVQRHFLERRQSRCIFDTSRRKQTNPQKQDKDNVNTWDRERERQGGHRDSWRTKIQIQNIWNEAGEGARSQDAVCSSTESGAERTEDRRGEKIEMGTAPGCSNAGGNKQRNQRNHPHPAPVSSLIKSSLFPGIEVLICAEQ